jgi:hypothetical protein
LVFSKIRRKWYIHLQVDGEQSGQQALDAFDFAAEVSDCGETTGIL